MQYAIVNGNRATPSPRTHGQCQICESRVISKCGQKVIWHWAHAPKKRCDPWWENETPWHREWKSRFPEGWRERVHFDPVTNEKHVADVKTDTGLVIEFQNSPIQLSELRSRERFYGQMLWVVNGAKFEHRFHILDALPDPNSELAKDLAFWPQRIDKAGRCFWRISENTGNHLMVRIHDYREIETEIWENYVGHHHFHWIQPHSVWYDSERPVYFDFGDEYLYLLNSYDERGLMSVQKFGKGRIEYLANHNE